MNFWQGRFTTEVFKHDWIEYMAGASMVLGLLTVIIAITYFKKWKWLWREWLTTVDHKKIGIMYLIVSAMMLFKGLIDAGMMRAQQAIAFGDSLGYLGADHFQQIFTAHGATMIFFVAMGVIFGIINLIIPLQIGARDVAFPLLNSISFWLFSAGSLYILVSLILGFFAGTGWSAYPPLAGLKYNPGVGVDYWIWMIQISGLGTTLSGVNFLVTILKMRCPGMTLMRMPIFVWTVLVTMVLVIFAFPILTATTGMLLTDRLLGTHIFTSDYGGNPMMYINLFWAWGHPEVYILILPAFGFFSEIVPVFSQKRLFGYTSMVWATIAIAFLSFIVWLHHFYTMGAGPYVNAFFGMMTVIISVPTGVKIFNWLFTMARGRVLFTTPMYWFIGFVVIFTFGGMAGVILSIPAVDFQLHNSLFLVAHFHSVIIGGVLFAIFSAYTFWFPKFSGFRLNETWGKWAFWFWFFGFIIAFLPLYLLGLDGMTRRLNHYNNPNWQPLLMIAFLGFLLIFIGFICQLIQLYVSIKQRKKGEDMTDPWNGYNLEWSTSSPPPFYNYASIPKVDSRDAFMESKKLKIERIPSYHDIHMPKNSSIGLLIGCFSFFLGFAMVFYLYWLASICFIGILTCLIRRLYQSETEYTLTAEEVRKIEKRRGHV
ncbi:MAG: cbb3-type cytochrome c oxidase subunit I [Chlamydiales bacterium]